MYKSDINWSKFIIIALHVDIQLVFDEKLREEA